MFQKCILNIYDRYFSFNVVCFKEVSPKFMEETTKLMF